MKRILYYFIAFLSVALGFLNLLGTLISFSKQSFYSFENTIDQFVVYVVPYSLLLFAGIYLAILLWKRKNIRKSIVFLALVLLLYFAIEVVLSFTCSEELSREATSQYVNTKLWSADFFKHLFYDYLSGACPHYPSLFPR